LQHLPGLPLGATAHCSRCGRTLATQSSAPLDRPLALTLAAAIAFIVANTAPLLSISATGRHASTTIGGGVYEMWRRGQELTALIVAFCAIAAPGCYILLFLTVLVMVRRPPAPSWVGDVQRWADVLPPWSMNDVLALGILVALTKISELARVDPGIGLYAVGGLTVLFPALATTFDAREVWKRIEWADHNRPSPRTTYSTADSAARR